MIAVNTKFPNHPEPQREEDSHQRHNHRPWHRSRRDPAGGQDYISLTDMLTAKNGDFFISDWLRNRNTVEFLGIWESVHNPSFNSGEFAIVKSQAGLK